jgi:hypothetical protein
MYNKTYRGVSRLTTNYAVPARVDADKTAKPLTRLIGHARRGDCIGPCSVDADALEEVETGKRTPLAGQSQ